MKLEEPGLTDAITSARLPNPCEATLLVQRREHRLPEVVGEERDANAARFAVDWVQPGRHGAVAEGDLLTVRCSLPARARMNGKTVAVRWVRDVATTDGADMTRRDAVVRLHRLNGECETLFDSTWGREWTWTDDALTVVKPLHPAHDLRSEVQCVAAFADALAEGFGSDLNCLRGIRRVNVSQGIRRDKPWQTQVGDKTALLDHATGRVMRRWFADRERFQEAVEQATSNGLGQADRARYSDENLLPFDYDAKVPTLFDEEALMHEVQAFRAAANALDGMRRERRLSSMGI